MLEPKAYLKAAAGGGSGLPVNMLEDEIDLAGAGIEDDLILAGAAGARDD